MPVVQEEITTAQCRDAGAFKDRVGEIFVGCERGGGGTVLRIPRTSSGAEMNAAPLRRNAEDQSRSTVDVLKGQPDFGAGIFRIDRLVRIEGGLSRSKFPQLAHALSGGLAFPIFEALSLTNFCDRVRQLITGSARNSAS